MRASHVKTVICRSHFVKNRDICAISHVWRGLDSYMGTRGAGGKSKSQSPQEELSYVVSYTVHCVQSSPPENSYYLNSSPSDVGHCPMPVIVQYGQCSCAYHVYPSGEKYTI